MPSRAFTATGAFPHAQLPIQELEQFRPLIDTDASNGTVIHGDIPVITMLLAETISPLQLAGGAMILSGVWLTSVRPATRRIGVRRVFRIPAKSPA
jgi:hypothetical protein